VSGLVGVASTSAASGLGGAALAARVERASRALDARGPEARRLASVEGAIFGVTVLAPGEPDAAPARSPDGRWLVACDGEALNLRALCAELGDASLTTPQAVARLVERAGASDGGQGPGVERAVARAEGAVAIAVWDARARALWLCRDPMGARTLCVAGHADGRVAFATDPRALRGLVGVAPSDDLAGLLADPTGEGAWRGVRHLRPGELHRVDAQGFHARSPADLGMNPPGSAGSVERWARSVEYGVRLSVRRHVPEGEPVAVATSGGATSCVLLALLAERRSAPVTAYCFAPDGADPDAEALASRVGVRLRVVRCDDAEALVLADELAVALDVPALDPALVGRWAIARAAADDGHRVLLTGDGSAALFGGASDLGASSGPRALLARAASVLRSPRAITAVSDDAPRGPPAARALWRERRALARERLPMLVSIAGAHGLRLRAPFADAARVELVAQVPIGLIAPIHPPRAMLRRAFPSETAAAPRPSPFPSRESRWIAREGALAGVAEALATAVPATVTDVLTDPTALHSTDGARAAWGLRMLARWRAAWG
jgi:asparagine synthetase B (glutamine-hydrolysing)